MSDVVVRRLATGVVIACVAALAVTFAALTSPSVQSRLGWATVPLPGYKAGEAIDVDQSIYSSSERTVLIFARSSCPACQRAKAKVAALVRELTRHEGTRVVMLHAHDGSAEDGRFATELGLKPVDQLPIDPVRLRVQRVPTIVVVTKSGTILSAHEGVPTDLALREVFHQATGTNRYMN